MVPALTSAHVSSLASKAVTPDILTLTANNGAIDNSASNVGAVNHHTPSHNAVSASTNAFYTMGPEVISKGPPPVSMDPKMALNSANVFEDLPRYLQQVGGPSNAAGMLAAQIQVTQATLGWSLIGQMASKTASGIQTLFNNQV